MRKLHITFLQNITAVFLLLIMALPNTTFAQNKIEVSGKVIDAQTKEAIVGAAITIKNSPKGTFTDAAGNFKVNVSSDASFIITYVGYEVKTEVLNGRTDLTVSLAKDTKALTEVVVTALGISKQSKAVGYAVQSVSSRDLTQAQDPNLINNLNGKVAGVQITNGGAGVGSTSRIVIRGENSFASSNQPLFVVDGVPVNNETFFNNAIENSSNQGTWAEVDYGNGAAEINSEDIAKVTVLKGAAAAALYGSRAANGAVILTTKKGMKEKGLLGVSINSTTTFETPMKLPRLQNQYGAGNGTTPYQYVDGSQSYENNIPNFGHKFDPNYLVQQFDSPAGDYQAADLVARSITPGITVTPTPWIGHADHFKKFLQTGVTTQNSVAISGSSDNGSFRLSVGTLYNTGILPNTDLRRYSVALRADHRFDSHLSTDIYINFINSNSDNRPNIGYGSESVMYTFFGVYGMPMNIDINSLKKQWQAGQQYTKQFRYWNNHDNPYVTLYDNVNSFNKNRLLGNASLKYAFNPAFNLMVRTGSDFYQDNREGHRAFGSVRFPSGGFRTDNVGYFENNTDFLFNYHQAPHGPFHMNLSLGGNRFMQNITYTRDIANTLIVPELYNFTNAQSQLPTLYQKFDKVVYSLYAFGDFDYKNLLFLNVTARNDRSSTLPQGNNSYYYPSASLSAIVSDMVRLPKAVSYLKVRASVAEVGRDADPYSINNTYLTNTPFNGSPLTTGNNVLANNNLKPSSTTTVEAGFEARFLNNRIGLDATFYNADTKDEIVQLPIPVSSGYTNAYVNGGKLNNKGIEIMLTVAPFRSKHPDGFNWDMNFNFSRNVGKVVSLPAGINTYQYAQITQYDRYYRSVQYNAVVGERLGNMYGNVFVRDPQGNIVYNNGVPVITTDQNHLLGNYNPDFILGWTNQFSYKHFNLSFVMDWHQGGKFFSYTELGVLSGGMSVETLPGRETGIIGKGVVMDASGKYTPNTTQVSAAAYYGGYYSANNNEPFMYNASYLKMREVRLGYTFNKIFGGISKSNLNVSLVGRNLFEFTQNKDVDPETLSLRGQQILPGTEFLSIPSTKSLGFSLGLTF
ncbi:SusC/RagA family TonB-linked outer membrane protein [Chitinophagaceae bacterium LWZ2-11]